MRAGDVVTVDFGVVAGSEPGFKRPAVVVTADRVLEYGPRTIHVVPLTTNVARRLPTEISVTADGLTADSAAQCHLCTVISVVRVAPLEPVGNVGPTALAQLREVLADVLDIP